MPLVMMVINSERVTSGRNGRIVSGASVWPMKMLAATLSDSAPLAPIRSVITRAAALHDELHDAEVIKHREKRSDENDGRQRLKREDKSPSANFFAEIAEDERRAVEGEIEQPVRACAQLGERSSGRIPSASPEMRRQSAGRGPRQRSFIGWRGDSSKTKTRGS